MRRVKKNLMAVCVGMMLLAGLTGCTKTVEPSQQMLENNGNKSSNQAQEDTGNGSDGAISQEKTDSESDNKATQEKTDSETGDNASDKKGETEKLEVSGGNPEDALAQYEIASQAGTEFLSGKIQNVEEDGMIIAQTTILEDGMVTLVDEKEAKKISVKFTEDTKVEHWTIKGGGADIDRKDAALSDLTAGMGVEMEGYYEGEDFVAIRVLIEEYV